MPQTTPNSIMTWCMHTMEPLSQNYWWPGLSRYVAKFIAGCDVCNQTKTFPLYRTTPSTCVHSSEWSSPTSKAFKAFTTRSSYWLLCQIHSMKMTSSPSNVMASVTLSSNTPGVSRVQSALSSTPLGWSAHLDRASGLPISLPGLWVRAKSNLERYRDHCAW